MKRILFVISLTFLFFSFSLLQADTVEMRNGHVLRCRILSQSRTLVKIQTTRGRIRWIHKRRIRRIRYTQGDDAAGKKTEPVKKEPEKKKIKKTNIREPVKKTKRETNAKKRDVKHEIVVLKTGRKIEGQVLSRRGRVIKFRTKRGRIRWINKKRIRKIETVASLSDNQTNPSARQKEEETKHEEIRRQEEASKREEIRRQEEASKREEIRRQEEATKREEALRRNKDRRAALLIEKKKKEPAGKGAEGNGREERKVNGETEKPPTISVSRGGALLRSAILPGWGQWSQNRKGIGFAYGGAFVAGTLAAYNANRFYLNARRDLSDLNNPFSTGALAGAALGASMTPDPIVLQDPLTAYLYSRPFAEQQAAVDNHYASFRMVSIGLFAFYAWNLFDAYFFHPTGTTPELSLSGAGDRDEGISLLLQMDSPGGMAGDWRKSRRTEAADQRFALGIRFGF